MKPPAWEKKAVAKRRLPFDLSKAMISGDTIASYEAKIYNPAREDMSATMIAGSSNTNTIVYVWIQVGSADIVYSLELKVTTTLGEIIWDSLAIAVK